MVDPPRRFNSSTVAPITVASPTILDNPQNRGEVLGILRWKSKDFSRKCHVDNGEAIDGMMEMVEAEL